MRLSIPIFSLLGPVKVRSVICFVTRLASQPLFCIGCNLISQVTAFPLSLAVVLAHPIVAAMGHDGTQSMDYLPEWLSIIVTRFLV